jgi:hypothetical protein
LIIAPPEALMRSANCFLLMAITTLFLGKKKPHTSCRMGMRQTRTFPSIPISLSHPTMMKK